MKILYHNDMDGKCAAHVVLWLDPEAEPGTCLIPMQYGMDVPFDSIGKDEKVYILDFSIEPEDMIKLLKITEGVVWIDHHKSAMQKYENFKFFDKSDPDHHFEWDANNIQGTRDIHDAGCYLTYRWFGRGKAQLVPEYIILIGDRDTWQWKFGDRTKWFFAGIESWDTSPTSKTWEMMREDPDSFIADGKVIQRYKDIQQREYILENGFWVEFHDYNCYVVNGRYSLQPFEACVPEADIWLTFRYLKDGYWMVSLYSTKVDVSEIAKQYQFHGKKGGGHKGAAGFECDYPPFLI
jgi:oligoribonuclease NrnB/cAMP/cGMP phosphodiesterase (DHH superfamily)